MPDFQVQERETGYDWLSVGPVYNTLQKAHECIMARRKNYLEHSAYWPEFRIRKTEIKYYDW